MAFVSLDPVEGLMRLQEELDRFFGKPPFDLGLPGPNVRPPINGVTDQGSWVVQADVSGVTPDELQAQVENGRLTISGERTPATEPNKGVSYHRRERRYGKFSRTIQLPRDLDPEKV